MPVIKVKSFDAPDETRRFPYMEGQLAHVGAVAVGRALLQPGWRWSTSIGAITGGRSCQVHHVSLILSGQIRFEMEDGEAAECGANTIVDVPPGHDAWVIGDEAVVLIDLYGNAGDVGLPPERQRIVTTILMSDIVDSTRTATRFGDARWSQLLGDHNRLVRGRLERFGGSEVNTTGDGFIATFPSAVAALRCALAIHEAVRVLDLRVRIGVHTGEVELTANDVHGVAVHAAARLMSIAAPGEIVTSQLTRGLVEDSDLEFEARGAQSMKGFDRPIGAYVLRRGGP